MPSTDYFKDNVSKWFVDGQSMPSAPSNIYVGLHTGDPGSDASANELSSGNYSRVSTSASSDWNLPSVGSFENTSQILFPEATSDWGTITYFSLWDGPADGTSNSLGYSQLNSSITIDTGDSAIFRSGNLTGEIL